MEFCPICYSRNVRKFFELLGQGSTTSSGQLVNDESIAWCCAVCGHAFKKSMSNTDEYYATHYKFSLESEDDDQIYEVHPDQSITFRTEHQSRVLLDSLQLPPRARILDYGCAKGLMTQWIANDRPDIEVFLFDVTAMHERRWQEIVPIERTAIGDVPEHWLGSFDAVALMFTLEHVEQPAAVLAEVRKLLKHGAFVHGVVPDIERNAADLLVRDHIHHYSIDSLKRLLQEVGFSEIWIDEKRHQAALTFTARKVHSLQNERLDKLAEISSSWLLRRDQIRLFEASLGGVDSAIFGAGVNGTFVLSCLKDPSTVKFVIDNNPLLHGVTRFGCRVISPADLPMTVHAVYSALNKNLAESIIATNLSHRSDLRVCV
jgi:2-polyprenyl-3-methyl-5-hydroxy-6-metoxy-1,4-benzoquinol methylase